MLTAIKENWGQGGWKLCVPEVDNRHLLGAILLLALWGGCLPTIFHGLVSVKSLPALSNGMAIHSDAPQLLLAEVLKGFVSPRDLYLHLSWKNLYFSHVGLASGFSTPRLLLMPENSLSRAPAGQFNPTHFSKTAQEKTTWSISQNTIFQKLFFV